MNLVFSPQVWEDYIYWQETSPSTVARINELLKDVLRHPFSGIGKPEPLRYEFKGYWSRRINQTHRLVYRPLGGGVFIAQARFHHT